MTALLAACGQSEDGVGGETGGQVLSGGTMDAGGAQSRGGMGGSSGAGGPSINNGAPDGSSGASANAREGGAAGHRSDGGSSGRGTESGVGPVDGASPDILAATPPMGSNNWNSFARNIHDSDVRGIADAMVSSGMKDVGYQYVTIDDVWADHRDGSGTIVPNSKFANMKSLMDYVHSKDAGLPSGPATVRDVYAKSDVGSFTGTYTAKAVLSNGLALLKITSQ